MDKHIIFSDVDGTIYGQDHVIHPQTIKDIKFAQSKGVEFVICTGNGVFKNQKMVSLAKKLNVRYIIAANGASIYDVSKQEFIYSLMIKREDAKILLDFANKNSISANWWDQEHLYSNEGLMKELVKLASFAMLADDKAIKSNMIENDIYKIEFYDTKEKVDLVHEFVKKNKFHSARMKPIHVEVTHDGVSKGHGIEKLCEILKVDIANTMGIGDSANDVGMFKVVQHSYVMDNANDDIKLLAKHYTSDVSQNGLGEAIIDYLHRTKLDKNNK